MELIYIGNKFYLESGTMMSPIYDVNGYRQDWGKVQIALQNGESVHIRPATQSELIPFNEKLEGWKRSKNEHRTITKGL